MKSIYKAHVDKERNRIQTVKEHSENTACYCRQFAIAEMKQPVYVMGLLHDAGKYQWSFQQRIDGKNVKVEHSICGAQIVKERYPDAMGIMMQYCIAGHHSGLPDGGFPNDSPDQSTLQGRMKRAFEDISAYKQELSIPDINQNEFLEFLMLDCDSITKVIDKFAFLTRFGFSCLTDADSLDTAQFCNNIPEKQWKTDFEKCLKRVEDRFSSFQCETNLQKSRSLLQEQVFKKADLDAEIYLMNMPTGSGKTLCSAKFALERAIRSNKKRIIYIIPYNSIIDQTADLFQNLFGEDAEILRHQSTYSYEEEEEVSEDDRRMMKHATENWDAQFIITTAVQFFESVYANKRGKLRKLHNMSDSILIFDEAHLMPVQYMQPCLQAVAYISRYLNSEALFLTATMPDFSHLVKKYALSDSKMVHLVDDTNLFDQFQKCRYEFLGELDKENIVNRITQYPSSLIIVNKRSTAREIYNICMGKKYHLSTYMTAYDRKRILGEIRSELSRLEKDFPGLDGVPEERRIVIVSTSLIEAGVDLDLYTVFRERAGLDHILQAGGRCNREGKRDKGDVYIFDVADEKGKFSTDERSNLTKGLLKKYEDISCPESIREYFDRLFFMKQNEMQSRTISGQCSNLYSIPFKTYAEEFEMVESKTVSVVVERDEKSRKLIEGLRYAGLGSIRKLQLYTCSVYQTELDDLIRQHAVDDFGCGIWCLTNKDYYDTDIGITFEARDYIL